MQTELAVVFQYLAMQFYINLVLLNTYFHPAAAPQQVLHENWHDCRMSKELISINIM